MKRVAEALEVSRSRLAERLKEPTQGRPPRYSKAEDEVLLPMIHDIIDHRLTYGYRRVSAVLNRRLKQEGRANVNHKRVYRVMQPLVLGVTFLLLTGRSCQGVRSHRCTASPAACPAQRLHASARPSVAAL